MTVLAAHCAFESHENFMNLNNAPPVCLSHPIEVQAEKSYTRDILMFFFQMEHLDGMSLFMKSSKMKDQKEFL